MADNSSFVVKNGIVVNTNVLVADSVNKRVGINTTSPDASLTVAGTANLQGNVVISGGNTLTVAANTTLNGNVIVNSNTYFNERIYIGNNINFVPLLRPVVQAVDKFNGFVQISSQNLANGSTDNTENSGSDSCSDLVVFADNSNLGLDKFLDMGMNNSNFDGSLQYFWANNNAGSFTLGETIYQQNTAGTGNLAVGVLKSIANIQFLYANLSSLSFFVGSKVYQQNTLPANLASGVVRAIEDIAANTTHKRLSVAMDYNSPSFVITSGANLAIRNISGSANSAIAALDTVQKELILSINTGYDEISVNNALSPNLVVRNISGTAAALVTNSVHLDQGWAGHRNYAFTIGKGNDGYLYIANGALTIGTTEGGRRAYSTALTGVSFASATNVITVTSTAGLYRDMFINGTGLANVAIRTVTNATSLVMASTTTAPSSGSYTAYDRYYDTSGNPIIFHTQGMYAESEIGRFVGNGNLVIGPNTMTR